VGRHPTINGLKAWSSNRSSAADSTGIGMHDRRLPTGCAPRRALRQSVHVRLLRTLRRVDLP